jgi:hypothetical protein
MRKRCECLNAMATQCTACFEIPCGRSQVRMWVYQEQVDGKNLTDIINEKHENVKCANLASICSLHPPPQTPDATQQWPCSCPPVQSSSTRS